MKPFLFSLIVVLIAGLARADQQIQSVQQALKDKGFYYGPVDGQPGPETDAAIKRYQIRQGLDVTGTLDAETLSSLDLEPGAQNPNTLEAVPPPAAERTEPPGPAQSQSPPPEEVQSDRDLLRNQPSTPAPAEPSDQAQPQQPAPAPPLADAPQYIRFFVRTPYQFAPLTVQFGIVQRSKKYLTAEGFYQGAVDGELTGDFTRALAAFQQDTGMIPTARLDNPTLAQMNLLPRRHLMAPVPYFAPPPVYRGIWIRP